MCHGGALPSPPSGRDGTDLCAHNAPPASSKATCLLDRCIFSSFINKLRVWNKYKIQVFKYAMGNPYLKNNKCQSVNLNILFVLLLFFYYSTP